MPRCSASAKKKSKRRKKNLPSISQITAGCFIDFEGFAQNKYQKHPPPVLVGILRGDVFRQVVFTEAYRWACETNDVEHKVIYQPDRAGFLKELADTTSRTKPLFAYSEHEKKLIEYLIGHKIEQRYANVLSIAKRWFNRHHTLSRKSDSNALVDVADALGIPMKSKLQRGGVTERLRRVRDYSTSKAKWDTAPARVHQDWKEVLEHNRSDVEVLRSILERMRRKNGK